MKATDQDSEIGSDSLYHKAGSFAIYAIIASFLLQFVFAKIWLRLPDGVFVIARHIPAAVILSAIPAGLIALCGIPKYGMRKLLWKGAVGLVFPISLFLFSVYYSAYLQTRITEEVQKMEQENERAESGRRRYLASAPHTTRHAGPHRAVPNVIGPWLDSGYEPTVR
jgi:hypothetical protein